MKRHANVYVVASEELKDSVEILQEMELSLALDSVRARCFSSVLVEPILNSDSEESKKLDYDMTIALRLAIVKTCDAVAVIGGDISNEMLQEIQLAIQSKKPICVAAGLQQQAKEKGIPMTNEKLATVCKEALAVANQQGEIDGK